MNKQKPPKRTLAYFTTPFGRKLVFFAAGTTTVGLFLGNFLPHTFLLNKYQEFVQCYKDGIVRRVPDVIEARLEKAMNILDVAPYERRILKPFVVYGFDMFTAGSTKSKYGGLIGIPTNYSYTSIDTIDRSEIRFRNEQIKWGSESGQMLQEALVLTEDEQIFGMCKAILQLQTQRVMLNAVFPSVSFMAVYSVGNYLNHKLNLLAKPLSLRLMMYTFLGLFGVGSWSFMKDYNQVLYDTSSDKKLSALGPEFVDAGVRYYDKLLKKNMALRALIGDDTYTSKGNENFYLRQKSLPLTIHKAFFEEEWKKLKGEKQEQVAQ
ncbi:transmembrane protein 177 [Episyrphus balteatus]|uniref:transmembrane protein 177 n=1 Tax=Episyrphus balteatus TaxID=286459 RepID=UPI002486A46B|nr:transmembrane protein 177 [Episyrphus balteatus]